MKTIKILQGNSGHKNSDLGVDIAISESLKDKKVCFVFSGYLTRSFNRFNRVLVKNGIENYRTPNLSIILDKLLVTEPQEVSSWIDRNISSNVDLLVVDTLNIATKKYKKSKRLQPCIDNLRLLSDTLDCDLLLLHTGEIPWLLKTTFAQYK